MSRMYRGPSIQPLNTGWIDGHVACVREWVANIFFYRKDGTTIMMDAGYNYDRLAEKMAWLGIAPESIRHILITHQGTDHVGAVEEDNRLAVRSLAELEEDNRLAVRSLAELEEKLRPLFITGHTSWTDCSTSPSRTRTGSARRLRRRYTTPPRRMTPMTSRTTRGSVRRAAF